MYKQQPYLDKIEEVIARGPYHDDWESLSAYRVPKWYRDAKFGIFIHWGVYSVPAFDSEWYSRNMYIQGSRAYQHHRETYGPQNKFGYKDFIPLFQAKRYDPEEWADLFVSSGAKYVVPVAEHHDGFQMYQSALSHWNAVEMGPRRDTLGELTRALTERGLVNGASSHRIEHWFFMGHGKEFDSDIKEPMERGDFYWPAQKEPQDHFDFFSQPTPTEEFLDDWLIRTCELIDAYRPNVLYFDWWISHSSAKKNLKKIAAYYYNRAAEWGREVVINYKHDAFAFGCAVPDVERGVFSQVKPFYWQTDTAVARNSWCYTEGNSYKDPEEILQYLADVVSKNGNLLLNIGPKADGTIPEEDAHILREVGKWLSVNGEAIYGSHVWREYGEGPTVLSEGQFTDGQKPVYTAQDFRYTAKDGALYAIAMKAATEGTYCLTRFALRSPESWPCFDGIVTSVEALGFPGAVLGWERTKEGLMIQTKGIDSPYPVVFRITTG